MVDHMEQLRTTDYITVAAAADKLGNTPHQTAELADMGALPSVDVLGRLFVKVEGR
jgi:hypothetical protein